ncbi:uncharacterized protein LOC120356032, partial [Nilaparvata lugens]|uniref:uncharacterized protein LOC120356032 n=1 Tax=Nilaparvata lugens TaxID=108931 RepID=UPI00193CB02E
DSKFDFTTSSRAHIFFQSDGCSGTDNEINYLEHVQVIISLSYPYRGAVGILLESPSGTKTVLMETRPRDNSSVGLTAWTLTSVHQWGEPADGRWTVKVGAKVVEGQVGEGGHFADFKNGVSRLAQHRFGSHRDNDLDERHNHYDRHAVTSDEDGSADRLSDLERRLIDLGTSLDDLHENANELRPSLDDLEPRRNFHQPSLDKVEGHVNDVEPSFGDLENPGYHNRPSFGDLENPGYLNRPSFGDLENPEIHNRPTFGDLESHNRPTFGDLEGADHPNDLESRETHHRPSFKGLDDLMMNVDGHVTSVRILLHGTREMPDHYKDGRRGYSTYGHPREMDDADEDDVNRKKERSKRRMV